MGLRHAFLYLSSALDGWRGSVMGEKLDKHEEERSRLGGGWFLGYIRLILSR